MGSPDGSVVAPAAASASALPLEVPATRAGGRSLAAATDAMAARYVVSKVAASEPSEKCARFTSSVASLFCRSDATSSARVGKPSRCVVEKVRASPPSSSCSLRDSGLCATVLCSSRTTGDVYRLPVSVVYSTLSYPVTSELRPCTLATSALSCRPLAAGHR